MEIKSLSATALHVAELCPARFKAEHVDRGSRVGGGAATLGTTVHDALENYVKRVYMEKVEQPNLKLLLDLYRISYISIYGTHDTDTPEFVDGYEMLKNWFDRTDFDGVTVLSVETKENFPVPTSIGEIPFNYIWDRFDQISENEFKVVDYKSNRWGIQPSDLKKKIQARAYAVAAAIKAKQQGWEPKRIWVEFDLLRHGPVGTVFSREDNAATWRYIKDSAQELVDKNPDEVEERLNPECLFCVRKADCKALAKNIMVGGIHSIPNIEAAIDLRAQLEWQKKGLESLIQDLDKKILTEARERDLEEYESDTNRLRIAVSSQRAIDPDMVEMALGPKIFSKYGNRNITMASVDKLLKGKELDDQQKAQLRSLIYQKKGEPKVKVEPKNPIDED